jgi:hypothetical protein
LKNSINNFYANKTKYKGEAYSIRRDYCYNDALEKTILWAIGVGNYNSRDIYVEGNKKLKE